MQPISAIWLALCENSAPAVTPVGQANVVCGLPFFANFFYRAAYNYLSPKAWQRRSANANLWVTLTLLVLASAAFFSLKAVNNKPTKIDPEKLAKVERIDLARSVVATGKVQPVTQVEIKSKASGIILKLPVNVGDFVHKGQVICELDQNDLIPALHQQEAALHVSQAALKSAQADYERYKVDATGPDVPFLKRDMERARSMFTGGLIAQNARDDAEKNYELAVQKQESAKANLGSASSAGRSLRRRHPSNNNRLPPSYRGRKSAQRQLLCRPSMASCYRATAKLAMPSVRSCCWVRAPL